MRDLASGVWSQGLRAPFAPVPSPPHSGPRLDPSLALGKEGWGDIKPTQRPARSRSPGSGSQWTCLAGAPPAWEAATWGKWLSQPQPHTSALFPWLHCVLGSLTAPSPYQQRQRALPLPLTLAVTPPTLAAACGSHCSQANSAIQAVPLPGQPQSWVSG